MGSFLAAGAAQFGSEMRGVPLSNAGLGDGASMWSCAGRSRVVPARCSPVEQGVLQAAEQRCRGRVDQQQSLRMSKFIDFSSFVSKTNGAWSLTPFGCFGAS